MQIHGICRLTSLAIHSTGSKFTRQASRPLRRPEPSAGPAGAAAIAFAIVATSAATWAGKIIVGGDDLDDHGFHAGGVNHDGWLYIQRALTDLRAPGCITVANDETIAALGSSDSLATSANSGGAIHYAAAALVPSAVVQYVDGAVAIGAYLDGVANGLNKPAIIWIPSDSANNGLATDEIAMLGTKSTVLRDFVNSGGALMAHSESSYPGGNPWLSAMISGCAEVPFLCSIVGAALTPMGLVTFPGVTNADITSGPCHSTFTGIGSLHVLAVDGFGRSFIIGGDCGTAIGDCDVIQNQGFVNGNVPGTMPSPGSVANWSASTGAPQVLGSMGANDPGFVQLKGNRKKGDSIQQTLASPGFLAANRYRISFSARRVNVSPPGAWKPPVRIRVRASNGPLNSGECLTGCSVIGVTSYISNTNWVTITLPDWIPAQNRNTITINAENGTGFGPFLFRGTCQIDNVCIVNVSEITPCASSFCFGDNAGTLCPCAPGSFGLGCANSTDAGARLTASGSCSISTDDLVVTCSGMVPNTLWFLRQGTAQIAGGFGATSPSTDGLDCIGGAIMVLGPMNTLTGAVSLTTNDLLGLAFFPGGTYHYQAIYEDQAAYCTPASMNSSNGVTLNWAP